MEIMDIMRSRHSVRQYLDKPIPEEIRAELDAYKDELNQTGDLHMQIFYDDPDCFNSIMARYGKFDNVRNYIAVVGQKESSLDERAGFYGEHLVLKAQELGLNTCWVALTHGKSNAVIDDGEKEVIIIALGYGVNQGVPHKVKKAAEISNITEDSPEWFRRGIEAVLLAPTAINQQNFYLEVDGNLVRAQPGLLGACLKIDLGIVKCHFELAAGKENFFWG